MLNNKETDEGSMSCCTNRACTESTKRLIGLAPPVIRDKGKVREQKFTCKYIENSEPCPFSL